MYFVLIHLFRKLFSVSENVITSLNPAQKSQTFDENSMVTLGDEFALTSKYSFLLGTKMMKMLKIESFLHIQYCPAGRKKVRKYGGSFKVEKF